MTLLKDTFTTEPQSHGEDLQNVWQQPSVGSASFRGFENTEFAEGTEKILAGDDARRRGLPKDLFTTEPHGEDLQNAWRQPSVGSRVFPGF